MKLLKELSHRDILSIDDDDLDLLEATGFHLFRLIQNLSGHSRVNEWLSIVNQVKIERRQKFQQLVSAQFTFADAVLCFSYNKLDDIPCPKGYIFDIKKNKVVRIQSNQK